MNISKQFRRCTNDFRHSKSSLFKEAEAYNNYQIAPLLETIDEAKEDFEKKTILKAVLNGKIVGSVRGDENEGTCLCTKINGSP